MHFISGIKSGGVEQMLINYTGKINESYKDVHEIIVYQHDPNKVCLKKLTECGNKCVRIANKKHNPVKNIFDTFKIIIKEKPDIIHAHMNLLNFIPLFCGFVLGIKIRISHSHIANNNIKYNFISECFKKLNILFASCLLSCGQEAGKYMYKNRKFKIIYNSVDISNFKFNEFFRKNIRRKLKIKDDEILIGNIGRLTEQKNQAFIIKLASQMIQINPKYKFIILGDGELKKSLYEKICQLNIEENFILHDPVEDVNRFYCAMDIFVLPSLYEGFPVSVVEAQVSGLPCYISDKIDKTSKINDDVFFLPIKDSSIWEEKLYNFSKSNRNINLLDFRKFNIDHSYKELFEIYSNLINKTV